MKRFIYASVLCSLIALLPLRARAVSSISGIVIYATDDFGDPYGATNFDDCNNLQTQLWRTALDPKFYSLAVWAGLPPNNLGSAPLSDAGFRIELPIVDGENDFTIVGDEGSNSMGELTNYDKYVVNLYFDSILEFPGLSVLFDRRNPAEGGPVGPNRAKTCKAYSLALGQVDGDPQSVYDDGVSSVSITAASFLPSQQAGLELDRLGAHGFASGGDGFKDFIGVLKVTVGPSTVDGAGAPLGGSGVPAPMAPDSRPSGGGLGGPAGGAYPGYPGAGLPAVGGAGLGAGQQANPAYGQQAQRGQPTAPVVPTPQISPADGEATPEAGESPTGGPTQAVGTGTPAKTHPTTPASTAAHTTPTPKSTAASAPMAHATTPAMRHGGTPTPAPHVQGTPHAQH